MQNSISKLFLLACMFLALSQKGRAAVYVALTNSAEAMSQLKNIKSGTLIDVCADISLPSYRWEVPDGCSIRYSGGLLRMAEIVGRDTRVLAAEDQLFEVNKISGSWKVNVALPEWFGAKSDGKFDCSSAIAKAMLLNPSELKFTQGTYLVSQPILTHHSDICISRDAILAARNELSLQMKDYKGKLVTAQGLIVGDYTQDFSREVYGLQLQPKIYGGGCIDGRYKASVGILLNKGFRVIVRDLTIKDFNKFGFVAALSKDAAGSSIMQNCTFVNDDGYQNSPSSIQHHPNAVAIRNNRYDCTYEDVMIINYQVGVVHEADNGKFTNIHSWLRDGFYWPNSVVFDCYAPDVTLVACDADTMRKLVKCHSDYFFANIISSRAYKNPDVVSDELACKYPPLIVDKGDTKDSQVYLSGGAYWFEVPYEIINNLSSFDRVKVHRYNRGKVTMKLDN